MRRDPDAGETGSREGAVQVVRVGKTERGLVDGGRKACGGQRKVVEFVFRRSCASRRRPASRQAAPCAEGWRKPQRVLEAHHAEPRKHGICASIGQCKDLRVGLDKIHLGRCRVRCRAMSRSGARCRPPSPAVPTDPVGKLEERLACAAANVENPVPRSEGEGVHRGQTQRRELAVDPVVLGCPDLRMQAGGTGQRGAAGSVMAEPYHLGPTRLRWSSGVFAWAATGGRAPGAEFAQSALDGVLRRGFVR